MQRQAVRPSLTPIDPGLLRELEQAAPGAVLQRATDRLARAHDASHYLLTPQAVVAPRDAAEVARLLAAAAARGIGVTFRSGGTSLSGQGITDQLQLDTRRHFKGYEILDDGARVRVQPGCIVGQINAALARHGRKLGPDPASEAACTVGGIVANNSGGMLAGTEFTAYRTLESAVLILASGSVLDTADTDADTALQRLEPDLHAGLLRLRDRLRGRTESVREIRRQFAIKNTMGYGLNAFLDHDRPIDILTHLVIGSEGTLAFVAEAVFRTIPVKGSLATGLLVFEGLADATGSLPALVEAGFAAIELLDATSLKVSQQDPKASADLRALRVEHQAALLVELQEDSPEALDDKVEQAKRTLAGLPAANPELNTDAAARAAIWHIRKGLYALVAGHRPSGTNALLEDVAVPVPELLQTCESLEELFAAHGYRESVIFGHAKDGNLHFMLNEQFAKPDHLERYIAFTEEMVELILGHGGTLKAEHGTGRIMAPFVRRQYGDELYEVMREIKTLCDPGGVLNPGIVISDDETLHVKHLKVAPTVEEEVDRCVECGFCERLCPSKDLTLTPRQRIVLRRERAAALAAGDDTLIAQLDAEYGYDGLETCAVDGMCQTGCPVLIDTGQLVKRLREEQHGRLSEAAWAGLAGQWSSATRLGSMALSGAARLPDAVPAAASAVARRVAGTENVPAWTPDLPPGGSRRRPRSTPVPDLLYFPACISELFGAEGVGVRAAFLALCARAGLEVRIPEGIAGLCCGTPWKSKGYAQGYRKMRERVTPILREGSAGGRLPLVVDAASCSEGLAQLLADEDGLEIVDAVAFVAENVLPRLEVPRKLESLALHPTCSSTRMGLDGALARIADAVSDEVVVPEGWGCCGFAGDRGLLHPELTASATRAEAAAVRSREFSAYASCNRTCEVGMSRATGRPYRHLLEVLEEVSRRPI